MFKQCCSPLCPFIQTQSSCCSRNFARAQSPGVFLKHTCINATFAFPAQMQLLGEGLQPTRLPRALQRRSLTTASQTAGTVFLYPQSSKTKRNDRFLHCPLHRKFNTIKKVDNKSSNFASLISSIKEAINVESVALFLNKIIKLCKEKSFYH